MSVANLDSTPIFIIGSARAGTSALVMGLRDGAGIPGDNEGYLISLLLPILKVVREQSDALRAKLATLERVGVRGVEEHLIEAIRKAQDEAFSDVKMWIDKTPDAPTVRAIPHLVHMWPNAKFVYARRRGIENIVSRMRKFPHLSFQEHCERWVRVLAQWEDKKERIAEENRIEIDQREIGLHPKETAFKLGNFLGLDERVSERIADVFANSRPEFTGGNEHEAVSIDTVGWSAQQIKIYRDICGETAARWGYSEDENYCL